MVAALFVIPDGPYSRLADVECWDEARDARIYDGPWPVVAHPPCARWGRYWSGGPSPLVPRKRLGDDGGCFESALRSVNRFGGILEHPEASWAWRAFSIATPPRRGGWTRAGLFQPGWTCCVEQGHYGHRARKATWLYAAHVPLPDLRWGTSGSRVRLGDGYHSADERRRAIKTGACQLMSKRQRAETPVEFAQLLVSIASKEPTP